MDAFFRTEKMRLNSILISSSIVVINRMKKDESQWPSLNHQALSPTKITYWQSTSKLPLAPRKYANFARRKMLHWLAHSVNMKILQLVKN